MYGFNKICYVLSMVYLFMVCRIPAVVSKQGTELRVYIQELMGSCCNQANQLLGLFFLLSIFGVCLTDMTS